MAEELVLILRFRDLVNPTKGHTVDEHNEVTRNAGYVWWGWWKKQNEEVPVGLWSQLARQIDNDGARAILLDSGQRRLFEAPLLAIDFKPNVEPFTAPEDGQKTSAYYAGGPFTTWFKLGEIRPLAEAALNDLVYAKASDIDSITHDDIVPTFPQLEGTRIVNVRELLQFGNVTYWIAKPAPDGTPAVEQERIFPRTRLAPIAPKEPVFANLPRILHLSDPHLHPDYHQFSIGDADAQNPTLASIVYESLKPKALPGLVVVTGDLTWTGTKEEFEFARDFLEDLRAQLGLQRDHFVLLPGNHDIQWSEQSTSEYDWSKPVRVAADVAKANYREFLQRWYRVEPNQYLAVGRRYFVRGAPTLDVVGLNTSELQQDRNHFAGLGRVTDEAFSHAVEEMSWSEDIRGAQLRVLAVHHHILPVVLQERASDSPRGFGISLDAGLQIRRAAEFGVDLVVHGHQHHPHYGYVRSEPKPNSPSRGVLVLGAGSCGVRDDHLGPIRKRQFNLITLHRNAVEVDSYVQESGDNRFRPTRKLVGSTAAGWQLPQNERSQ
ncbi:MAG: metallophosphoesterase [Deltaproteobacteria bacterium]|jgi:3',5'-cyclic AMP phosphodiesterase CpdA